MKRGVSGNDSSRMFEVVCTGKAGGGVAPRNPSSRPLKAVF